MAKLYDMAQMSVSGTPGTGPITLGAAATVGGVTYLTFTATGVLDGDFLSYRITDGSAWEVGRGTYTAVGTTLSRGFLKSSTGSAISATSAALVSIVALAEDFSEDAYGTVSAAGATQATATPLIAVFTVVTTVAAGTGVQLPAGSPGNRRKVRNSGANALLIYPRNGDNATINNQAANASIQVLANSTAYFEAASLTQWFTIP